MSNPGSRVEHLISQYFNQLLHGCGNPQCTNPDCASSPCFSHERLTPNQAAIIAVRLTSSQARLCLSDSQTEPAVETPTLRHQNMPLDEDEQLDSEEGSDLNRTAEPSMVPDSLSTPSGSVLLEDSSWASLLPPAEVTRLLMLLLRAPNNEEPAAGRSRDTGFSRLESDIPSECPTSSAANSEHRKAFRTSPDSAGLLDSLASSLNSTQDRDTRTTGLTLDELKQEVETGKRIGDWSGLIELLSSVFSSYEALSTSFPSDPSVKTEMEQLYSRSHHEQCQHDVQPPAPLTNVPIEEVQSVGDVTADPVKNVSLPSEIIFPSDVEMRCPRDDDDDHVPADNPELKADDSPEQPVVPVNIHDVRLAWSLVSTVPDPQLVVDTLMRAVRLLVISRLHRLLLSQVPDGLDDPNASEPIRSMQQRLINLFIILYECPFAKDPSHFEHLLLNINRAVTWLPITLQARLCRAWANTAHLPAANSSVQPQPEQTNLWSLQRILLQHITLRCLTTDFGVPNEDKQICEAALVLRIVYYASILAGEMDSRELLDREAAENGEFEEIMRTQALNHPRTTRPRSGPVEDPLEKALSMSFHDCRKPLIPAKDFVNETLNEAIKPKRDYVNYRSNDSLGEFSFMRLPFLLQTKLKSDLLHYDSRMRMMEEQRGALVLSFFGANQELPYLKLHVSRDRVIEDTLLALEITCLEKPSDLKKQLLIEFEGEQGVDEGGLSKEFFQLIIEKIFDRVYGMFVCDDELGTYWFNPEPLDDLDREYCLIGILLGLAIYNDIILDVRFPSVLYRKLSGKLGTYEDLKDARPDLIPGLQALLDYDGDDLEGTFDCNFVISYQDPFGNNLEHELLPGGASIPVTKSNRQQFVDLYADFLLNKSVKKQFTAFRRGFQMVVDESPLRFLFRADEIELLVRGSPDYDFTELERVTKYDGYTADSPVIKNFWYIVHNHMTKEQQYQLLQFATGSDRIPAGGMSHMKFTIARQGADADRLPTAHTCFNILLLPDYPTLKQLQHHLLLAIAFCKGFGMS